MAMSTSLPIRRYRACAAELVATQHADARGTRPTSSRLVLPHSCQIEPAYVGNLKCQRVTRSNHVVRVPKDPADVRRWCTPHATSGSGSKSVKSETPPVGVDGPTSAAAAQSPPTTPVAEPVAETVQAVSPSNRRTGDSNEGDTSGSSLQLPFKFGLTKDNELFVGRLAMIGFGVRERRVDAVNEGLRQ